MNLNFIFISVLEKKNQSVEQQKKNVYVWEIKKKEFLKYLHRKVCLVQRSSENNKVRFLGY